MPFDSFNGDRISHYLPRLFLFPFLFLRVLYFFLSFLLLLQIYFGWKCVKNRSSEYLNARQIKFRKPTPKWMHLNYLKNKIANWQIHSKQIKVTALANAAQSRVEKHSNRFGNPQDWFAWIFDVLTFFKLCIGFWNWSPLCPPFWIWKITNFIRVFLILRIWGHVLSGFWFNQIVVHWHCLL